MGVLPFLCAFCPELVLLLFQVHYILNELVMGGMVLETNMSEIIARIEDQSRIEKQEVRGGTIPRNAVNSQVLQAGLSAAPARAVSAVKNMNIPQQLKDMKFSDLPNISGLKF